MHSQCAINRVNKEQKWTTFCGEFASFRETNSLHRWWKRQSMSWKRTEKFASCATMRKRNCHKSSDWFAQTSVCCASFQWLINCAKTKRNEYLCVTENEEQFSTNHEGPFWKPLKRRIISKRVLCRDRIPQRTMQLPLDWNRGKRQWICVWNTEWISKKILNGNEQI